MRKVPGSFTGEVLRDELIEHISGIKHGEGNAFETIRGMMIYLQMKAKLTVEEEYKMLMDDHKVNYFTHTHNHNNE